MPAVHQWRARGLSAAIAVAAILSGVTLAPGEAAAGGGGCHAVAGPREGSGDHIMMTRSCFSPVVLRTTPGTTVTFENRDEAAHEVVGPGNEWVAAGDAALPGSVRPAQRATVRLNDAGIYPYSCMLHRGMTGTIVVGEGLAGAAVPVSLASQPARDSEPVVAAAVAAKTEPGQGRWFSAAWAAAGLVAGAGATAAGFSARAGRGARSG